MLIIGGTAEFIGETDKFTKGNLHAFTMFCSNEDLDSQLKEIEIFFNERLWDEIRIEEAELVDEESLSGDSELLNNDILKLAYSKANVEGLSVVMQNTPMSNAA